MHRLPMRVAGVAGTLLAVACGAYAFLPRTEIVRWASALVIMTIVVGSVVARRTPDPLVGPVLRTIGIALMLSLVLVVIGGLVFRLSTVATLGYLTGLAGLVVGTASVAAWERGLTRDPKRLRRFFSQPW